MSTYDRKYKVVSVNFNPANVVKATAVEQAITVPGVAVGDVVFVNKPTCSAGIGIVGVRVSAEDTVGVVFANVTGGSGADVNPAAEDYLFGIMRP